MDDGFRDGEESVGLPRESPGGRAGVGQDPIEDVAGGGTRFWQRLAGVLMCLPAAFAAFAGDRRATWQVAALVVVTGAIGLIFANLAGVYSDLANLGLESAVPVFNAGAVPLGFVVFAAWAGIVMLTSKLFSSESVSYGGWFRALGPITVTNLLQQIPYVGWILGTLYWLVLTFVAVRTVARVSRMAAIGIMLISAIGPFAVIVFLFALLFTVRMMMLG